jgi:outer membrane protein OmpA-like peptidoglycan-associated protein
MNSIRRIFKKILLPVTFKIPLFFCVFLLSNYAISQKELSRFSLEQKVIATDFIQAPNRNAKITSLPRGIELSFKKYTGPKSFLQLPIRVGFSRASNLDTFTTGKAFYGSDILYGVNVGQYRIKPMTSVGVGTQHLNNQWYLILPLNIGLEVPIDSAFCLSLHAGYRHATKKEYTTIQYGLGIAFKIGKRKKALVPNADKLPEHIVSLLTDSLLVIKNERQTTVIKELTVLKPPSLPFEQDKNIVLNYINDIGKNNQRWLQEQREARISDSLDKLVHSIQFKTNSSEVTHSSVTVLKALADILLSNPDMSLHIEGHTDNTGSETYNKQLSTLRANNCRKYLIKFGVMPNRLSTEGWGETRPKADNKTEVGRAVNRRVEIYKIFNK